MNQLALGLSELRARDIKRRLLRNHGYDLSEVERMIDKKEKINKIETPCPKFMREKYVD